MNINAFMASLSNEQFEALTDLVCGFGSGGADDRAYEFLCAVRAEKARRSFATVSEVSYHG